MSAKSGTRVVLVTGASRGIGLALVQKFKSEGWRVAACARSESIAQSGADFTAVCDVTDAAAVRAFVREAHARFGRIDALVNNAGLAGENPMGAEDSDEFWHQVIAVNLNGTYYFSKQVMPFLPSDGTGRIINIASVLAHKGVPDQAAYCAAKHGVLGFTRALALHLAPRRVTVNAICPGWTRTDMAVGRMAELGLSEKDLEVSSPVGRMIEPAEVAALALYLASPAASGMTGQDLGLG